MFSTPQTQSASYDFTWRILMLAIIKERCRDGYNCSNSIQRRRGDRSICLMGRCTTSCSTSSSPTTSKNSPFTSLHLRYLSLLRFPSDNEARSRGSPAYQFGLVNTMYITHLNGIATPGTPSPPCSSIVLSVDCQI